MEIKADYNSAETMAILGVGHSTLERWTYSGKIKSFKRGRFKYYPLSEVKRIMGRWKWEEAILEAKCEFDPRARAYTKTGEKG